MKNFKSRWEITKNWQLIHPFLGIVASFVCGYVVSKRISAIIPTNTETQEIGILALLSLLLAYLFIKISLWCFKKLENRWKVTYRWEFIAIFLCFAVTGSSAGRLSNPLMSLIGLSAETTNGWLYWPVRILLIFPIYQVLLVIFGWLFGQYSFFTAFARKMMSRMGLGFLIKNLG